MKRLRGFGLIDSLLGLSILLLATIGALRTASYCNGFFMMDREREVTRELLDHIKYLPAAVLDNFGTRYYDVRGQPAGEGARYCLRVKSDGDPGRRGWWCELTYDDSSGKGRVRAFERLEWRPLHEGI